MSYEIMKSMTYRNNKVYTRQCSNNVYPKHFYTQEHSGLTRLFNEIGKEKFEKWFLQEHILMGNVYIPKDCNGVLKRLNKMSDILFKDEIFRKYLDDDMLLAIDGVKTKNDKEKETISNKRNEIREDMKKYVSSFYDKYNLLLKKEKER